MKNILRLSLLTLVFALPQIVEAKNLYSIIVADTKDSTIGSSVTADLKHMRQKMQEIANITEMDLQEITIQGNNTKPAIVLNKLQQAEIKEDDVVVFYYSGHGYRTNAKGKSPWPNLAFSVSDEGMEYETIMSILRDKHPQFLLTMVDICNNVIPEESAPPLISPKNATRAVKQNVIDNYRLLFRDISGTIHITSSSIGEFSYGFDDGGLYTNAFLSCLNTEVNKKSGTASWQNILKGAYNIAQDPNPERNAKEHPYSETNVKALAQ